MNYANDTQRQIAHLKDLNFSLAGQIADIAGAMDYLKNMADPAKAQSAQVYVEALHDIAAKLAGTRAHELYAPDDEATTLQIAIAAGTACCGGEVNAGPGLAAVEGALA